MTYPQPYSKVGLHLYLNLSSSCNYRLFIFDAQRLYICFFQKNPLFPIFPNISMIMSDVLLQLHLSILFFHLPCGSHFSVITFPYSRVFGVLLHVYECL